MEKFKIDFNAPLSPLDSEIQTYGCRQNNLDICGANGIEGVCAFASNDHIYKKSSRTWKKQYAKLSRK